MAESRKANSARTIRSDGRRYPGARRAIDHDIAILRRVKSPNRSRNSSRHAVSANTYHTNIKSTRRPANDPPISVLKHARGVLDRHVDRDAATGRSRRNRIRWQRINYRRRRRDSDRPLYLPPYAAKFLPKNSSPPPPRMEAPLGPLPSRDHTKLHPVPG